MAISTPSLLQTLALVILAVISVIMVSNGSAAGNEQLIDKLCSVTFVPEACTSCVKSGRLPSGPNWTNEDVAMAVLNCAEDHFLRLNQDIMKAIEDPKTDQNVRQALVDCRPIVGQATEYGGVAAQDVGDMKFDKAKDDIEGLIFPQLYKCNDIIKAAGITPPGPVFADMLNVEADLKMADQILTTLK